MNPSPLSRPQARRLRSIHRSAGWPSQDDLELELLAAGWLESREDAGGRVRLLLTAAGLQALQAHRLRERARHDAHDRLVDAVAQQLCRQGRIVWTELALLSAGAGGCNTPAWRTCRPDVFSIRHTSSPHRLEAMVHEIKVRRADLLADLKQPGKRAAYLALGAAVNYVLGCDERGRPIGRVEDVPEPCGVWIWRDGGPELARPARLSTPLLTPLLTPLPTPSPALGPSSGPAPDPSRPIPLGFATWISLARAVPWHHDADWTPRDEQLEL